MTLTSLYLGEFDEISFNREDTLFVALFEEYLKAFAQQCTADLPPDKVEMTRAVCARERYPVNRYGAKMGPLTCVEYTQEGTRLYADPALYAYATAATDTGHQGDTVDASWAFHHSEKVVDFGYRAVHLTAEGRVRDS